MPLSKKHRFSLTIAALLLTLVACMPFGFLKDPPETMQTQSVGSNTLPLNLKWQVHTDDPIRFRPYALDGMVLIKTSTQDCAFCRASKAKLIALDAVSGEKLWESSFTGLFNDISPISFNDLIIFPINADTSLRAVSKETGEAVWETVLSENMDSLIHDDKYVFVSSGIDPSTVYAIDPTSGKIVWENSKDIPIRSRSVLSLDDGKLVSVFDTRVLVFEPKTGRLVRQTPANLPAFDAPMYQDGKAFFNPEKGIWAINVDSGQAIWAFEPDCIKDGNENEGQKRLGRYFLYAPSVLQATVYVTGGCKSVFALDAETGQLKWTYKSDNVGTMSHLLVIDMLGYVLFRDGSIRAIDLHTGQEKGRAITTFVPFANFPSNQGLATWINMLYVTFGGRTVLAFGQKP